MPDHVHLVLVPQTARALSDCLREIHRRYTRAINLRERWHGHLWQGRFCVGRSQSMRRERPRTPDDGGDPSPE